MPDFRPIAAALLALCLVFSFHAPAAEHAAKVVYAFGEVQAEGRDGQVRPLGRGAPVVAGDTVVTKRGRAQLRFTDGGFAALQPDTAYRVDDYVYKGEADGSERSFLSLVRGSVRLVTGIIGRANKQNYRIRTSVATIGIRGTSGRLSHCEANCGARGPGTKLQGYGGTWDLSSGSFAGPVESGQAKFCNGVSCFDLPGFGQREDVPPDQDLAEAPGEEDGEGPQDSPYQQGQQAGEDGTACDLGGGCGDLVVATGLVGAEAFRSGPAEGDSETIGDLAVVARNGVPIGAVAVAGAHQEAMEPDVGLLLSDVKGFRIALDSIGDPAVRALGNAILDAIPPAKIATLNSRPAVVATEDYGLTSDGALVKGRWTRGFLLDIEVFLGGTPEVFSELIELKGFQSDHFIFGPDPLFVPFAGQARYDFTGGTFSTAVNGASIGQGVTGGFVAFDFGLGSGVVDMDVVHGQMAFDVIGSLQLENDPRFFFDANVNATTVAGSYPVSLDGFFAVPNGFNAPKAAGLSYVIDMPVDLIGTAGFGLTGSSVPTILPPVAQNVVANGSYVAFAHHFLSGGTPTTNGDDFIVSPIDTAMTDSSVVTAFNSATPVDLCAGTPCTFDANGVPPVKDPTGPGGATTNAALGVSWARFGPGHLVSHNQMPAPNGPFHVLKVDVPTAMASVPGIASGVQGVYNMLVGGSRPTMVFETNGTQGPFIVGDLTSANMNVVFDMGSVSANFAGTFPAGGGTGNFTLTGGGPFNSAVAVHSLTLTGSVTSMAISAGGGAPNCAGPCTLAGHTHFDVIGVGATGVAGSIEASTLAAPKFGLSGTYVLQGSVIPYP